MGRISEADLRCIRCLSPQNVMKGVAVDKKWPIWEKEKQLVGANKIKAVVPCCEPVDGDLVRSLGFGIYSLLFTLSLTGVLPLPAQALKPEEILVVANRNARHSIRLAKYYMQKRGIPDENLVKLWVTDKEVCSRENYERKIAKRIKKKLLSYKSPQRPRCLALIYGVPLKVAPVPLTHAEKAELCALNEKIRISGRGLNLRRWIAEKKKLKS